MGRHFRIQVPVNIDEFVYLGRERDDFWNPAVGVARVDRVGSDVLQNPSQLRSP